MGGPSRYTVPAVSGDNQHGDETMTTEIKSATQITITQLGRHTLDVAVWDHDRLVESHTFSSRDRAAAWSAKTYPAVPVTWR